MRRTAQGLLETLNQGFGISEFMLPDPHDVPAVRGERAALRGVTLLVGEKFRVPEVCIPFRFGCVKRTAMPEASVHEDGQPFPAEDEVRPYPYAVDTAASIEGFVAGSPLWAKLDMSSPTGHLVTTQ